MACWPPRNVIDELESQLAEVKEEYRDLKWVKAGQLHVTLVFLGDVAEHDVDPVRGQMASACADTAQVRVRIGPANRFGRSTLWAGVDGDIAPLETLHHRLADIARAHGLAIPDHTWRPHLTLARAPRGGDVRPAVPALAQLSSSPWPVQNAELVQSRARDSGAEYDTIAGLPFGSVV